MTYAVEVEKTEQGKIAAYLPDMPGIGVVGDTEVDAIQLLDVAAQMHVDALIREGLSIPAPSDNPVAKYVITIGRTFVLQTDENIEQYIFLGDGGATYYPPLRQRLSYQVA